MEKLGRGLIILAITVALSVLQVPADVKIEQESSASETVKEVEGSYEAVLKEVEEINQESRPGDTPVKSSRMYLNTSSRLDTLQEWLDEQKPLDEMADISEYLFGKTASSKEELQQWHDNMDSYLLDTLSGRYLDFLMSKLKTLSTVQGTIAPDSIDIAVEDMDAFLDELIVSAEVFGKIWAVTDMYSGRTTFTDNGFTFTWTPSDDYRMDVNAIENAGRVYTDQETVKQVQEKLNKMGYDCGTPDGIAGNRTKSAVRQYRKEHGFSEGEDITQELIYDIDDELAAGNYSAEVSETNAAASVPPTVQFTTILSNLKTLVPATTYLSIGQPVEQSGMQASYILYRKNEILFLYGPRNGKTTLGVVPVSLNTDTNDEYFMFLSYAICSVDNSLGVLEALTKVMTTIERGELIDNGITYEFSQDDPTFYITW